MRLESVGKRYGLRQPWVVRDVSLDIAAARLIRLEGRNGSGKSTLLRVAAGVSLPSKGRVTGRPHTGYVPERFPGGLPFAARDYLLHMARVHGLRGQGRAHRAVDEWLERLGAASYAGQPLRSLSKGMCQKVAIAQALLSGPGLLVLDEAWTGLDQAARGALDTAVAERVADGGAVMFVDHDQARLAGRIDERWQLDGSGRVSVVPGGAGVPRGQDDAVVIIELDGVESGDGGSLARIAAMPGVLACSGEGSGSGTGSGSGAGSGSGTGGGSGSGTGGGSGPGAGRARARVVARESDQVLRQVLTFDGVHVAAVRAEDAAGERDPGRAAAAEDEESGR